MRAFFTFVSYLWPHYWWVLTGSPLIIESVLSLFFDYDKWIDRYVSRQKRKQITYSLALLGIIVASFLAFNNVYLELQDVRRDLVKAQEQLVTRGPEDQTRAIVRLEADKVHLETDLRSTQHALASLQHSLKARRLNPDERRKLTDVLVAHQGQPSGDLSVSALPSCHECMTYVSDFVEAINSVAGWAAGGYSNVLINVDFTGIGIGVHDPKSPPPVVGP